MPRLTLPAAPKEWEQLLRDMEVDAEDRTAVILGGSLVEATLDRMLLTWLVPEDSVRKFFDADSGGFLSSFGPKMKLAYALGLLEDEDERKQLRAIASVRNIFAHHLLDATFGHPAVLGPMRTLRELVQARIGAERVLTPREVFVAAVKMVAVSFNMRSLTPRTTKEFRRLVQTRVKRQWIAAARRTERSLSAKRKR